ncbi:MAG: HlyD family efflux transporter periplasmic adaptor subunit [Planctomycetes bacterium]|nr:HlyD family efflux transporter periplasmic adaptor subunit [Planctomycetota bacterium]
MKTKRHNRRGGTTAIVITIVVIVTGAAMTTLVVRNGSSSGTEGGSEGTYIVQRGSFDITIPASGELAALDQIEIRNRLEVRAVITEIIEEGKTVKAGDMLIRFNDEEIRNKIKDAEDAQNNADSALIMAESNLEIRISSSESEQDKAELDVTLAELALESWKEGEVVSRRQQIKLELQTAQKDYDRLKERYDESVTLESQKFISRDELKQDEIAMIRAKARLEQAKLDKEIYDKYQYIEDQERKESDVKQAKDEQKRIKDRHEAELATLRAALASKQHQLESRQERLADLQKQLEYCTVTAPSGGLVVFATSLERYRWGNQETLKVGSELRRNQLAMILPDTSQMVAEVKVNESLTGLIKPGQHAILTSDAVSDVVLQGEVLSISVLAESPGWIDRNRRDYTVKIRLTDGNDLGLKPSMRCKAEIYVGRVEDTLFVPLQAVFHEGPTAYVYVPQGSGFAQRKVTVGESSELHVAVSSGLAEGDVVLLREPHPAEIVARLDKAEGPEGWQRAGNGEGPPNRASAEQDKPRPEGEVTHKPGEKRPPAKRPAPSGDRPSAEG